MAVKEEVRSLKELKSFIGRQTRVDRRKTFEKKFRINEMAPITTICPLAEWECILLGHNH